jgi:three-Cys-motif partner protein
MMTGPKSTTWQLEKHTEAKHHLLRLYLNAWLPILTSFHGQVTILDGFAGPGEYAGGEPGSPLIAIDAVLNHSHAPLRNKQVHFIFIEADEKRYEHLKALLASRTLPPNVKYTIKHGEFDGTLTDFLDDVEQRGQRLTPTFAFIDPFGYSHTPMSTISRLMKNERCEVLINFMHDFINRFLTFDNEANEGNYDRLFGTRSWRAIIEQKPNPKDRERQLHDLYQLQLQTASGAKYTRSFRMVNEHNHTEYYLFFGTNSLLGLDKMKQAMWKVDPTGTFSFSDLSNPDQPFLFSPVPEYYRLEALLQSRFSGKSVTMREIEEYIIADTPFCSNQYKITVLKPMEQTGKIAIVNPPPKRKMGTYPDSSLQVKFV